jgi:hypothetical protein
VGGDRAGVGQQVLHGDRVGVLAAGVDVTFDAHDFTSPAARRVYTGERIGPQRGRTIRKNGAELTSIARASVIR